VLEDGMEIIWRSAGFARYWAVGGGKRPGMIYEFEDFTLDTGLFELRRGGAPVPVEPQVFELLALLVARHDSVVGKDDILDTVWNGRFVSDAALSSRIKAVRQALGDSGAEQRLIRTVHRRGFRFVGAVRERCEASQIGPSPNGTEILAPARTGATGETEMIAEALMERPAIAVLPFHDATDGAGGSYLADGLTEELIAALSAWRWFPVISRNTSFRYRGDMQTAPEIGRVIGARYLVTGSLQRAGDSIRVNAALVDTVEDRQLWSASFRRGLRDVFEVEEEIAHEVVNTLEPEVHTAEVQRIMRKAPDDTCAWDLAMRAAWHANRSSVTDFDEAERLAGEASALDPAWSFPLSLIAMARFQRAMRSWSSSAAHTAFADTLEAACRALEVDRNSWMAHALAGVGELWTNLHYDRALDHIQQAIKLNPSAAWCYHFGGCICGFAGELDTAIAHQSRVFRVDPAYPYTAVVEADLALWSMLADDLDRSLAHINRSVEWDPAYGRGWQRFVSLHGLRGDREQSDRGLRRLAELKQPVDRDYMITTYPFRDPAHRETFFRGLRLAGINL